MKASLYTEAQILDVMNTMVSLGKPATCLTIAGTLMESKPEVTHAAVQGILDELVESWHVRTSGGMRYPYYKIR